MKKKINILGLLLFLISYYYFYLSLEKCLFGENECSQKWNWILLKINQEINKSVFIIIVLIILIIEKVLSKLHLLHFVLSFIYFYCYSHSLYFHDHGGYNLIAFIIVLFFGLIFLLIIRFIWKIFKFKFLLKKFSIIVLCIFNIILIDSNNCSDWSKGLNNTYIENDVDKFGCQIKFPKRCDYKVLSFTQDLSKISHLSCSNKAKNSKERIFQFSNSPYINKNTLKFGFPLTNNNEGQRDGKDLLMLKTYTSHNLMDMDKNLPPNLLMPELIVDFSNDPLGEMKIKLKSILFNNSSFLQ